jgi:tetratricopeptide (TPR) repeat protein/transcriptional regulator with XRE-family HTH domain
LWSPGARLSEGQGPPSDTFATLLRRHRLALGLSQEDLAERSGLSVRTIANLEQGRATRPHRYSVESLGNALGLPEPERRHFDQSARVPAAGVYTPTAEPKSLPVPRQLPASVADFVGRAQELGALTAISDHVSAGAAVVISSIGGTAGVGKTALAVHWAHQAADRFPDGQLYVNLQGYDLASPLTVAQALTRFLAALGVAAAEMPAGIEEMAAMYRSMLAGRRLLVVLDNANHVEQVRPLLPGSSGCMAVVTSRDSLPGLVARDGARRLTVPPLPRTEAVSLLRILIGRRVDLEPGASDAMAAQCCRLPLALRVAAELAAARHDVQLADLVRELASQQGPLDQLDAGDDPRSAIRTVFSWSYRYLQPAAAKLFRLLGPQPCAEVDCYTAAAIAGFSPQSARQVLEQLARAHMIQRAGPIRYAMHDLLRAYARELAVAHDPEEIHDALTRQFDYYLHTASCAMDMLFPAERGRRPRITGPPTPVRSLSSDRSARAWLDIERTNLVTAVAHMTGSGRLEPAIQLASTLFRYLDTGGHFADAQTVHNCAREAASRLGDHAAEATALINLGSVRFRQGYHRQAASHFEHALEMHRKTGDPLGRIRALNNLGLANLELGNHTLAGQYFEESFSLSDAAGERVSRARALDHLGVVALKAGDYAQAFIRLERALAAFRDIGDSMNESGAILKLAQIDLRQQDPAQASVRGRQALELYRKIGDRTGEADAFCVIADAELQLGTYGDAISHIRQSLLLYRKIGSKSGEGRALNVLGDLLLATERLEKARCAHIAALRISVQTGDREEEARSHSGLAAFYESTGDPDKAHTHRQRGLGIYAGLHNPIEPAATPGQHQPSR